MVSRWRCTPPLSSFAAGATLLRQHLATGAKPEAKALGQQLQAFGRAASDWSKMVLSSVPR
jgi:hypothetical protein